MISLIGGIGRFFYVNMSSLRDSVLYTFAFSTILSSLRDFVLLTGLISVAIQQYGRGGAIVGAVSIPTRYLHQTIEMVSESDVLNSISLLTEAVKGLDQFDWGHR